MSGFLRCVNRVLWAEPEQFYKAQIRTPGLGLGFIPMQVVRLCLILVTLGVWALNFYVNVKKCVMYLNFWALTFTLLYLLCVFPSAGRQEVERKMLEKRRKDKGEAAAEDLEENEKSTTWKIAIFFHSLAWPFTVCSVVSSVFLIEDQVCATYFDFGFDQWRGVTVFIATYLPMGVLVIDFIFNKLVLPMKHLAFTLAFFLVYIAIAFIGTLVQDRPIYGHMPFLHEYGNNYDYTKKMPSDWAVSKRDDCSYN